MSDLQRRSMGDLQRLIEALRGRGLRIPAEAQTLAGLVIAVKSNPRKARRPLSLSFTLGAGGREEKPDSKAKPGARPSPSQPSGATWTPYVGRRGPHAGQQVGWVNAATGEVRYQKEKPGGDEAGGAGGAEAGRATAPPGADSNIAVRPPASFPTDAELAGAPAKDLKPGGQVRAVAVGDRRFVVKQAGNTATSGPAESLASDLARVAGVNMPRAAMTTVGGRPALVQEFAEGRTLDSLKKESPEAARGALAKVPKAQIDRSVLFDYLMGNSDVHDGNYMVSEAGDLTPIDKEMVLGRGNLTGQRFEPPHLLSLTRPDGAGMLHAFDPTTVAAMAEAGNTMSAELERRGMKREARQVRDRAVVLTKLAAQPQPTAGALYHLGSQGVTPPGLGPLKKVLWHLTKG